MTLRDQIRVLGARVSVLEGLVRSQADALAALLKAMSKGPPRSKNRRNEK